MESYKKFDALFCIEERQNQRNYTKYYEGALAQGSGYLQIRASYEEGLACAEQNESYMRLPANVTVETPRHPYSKWGVYVPGITGIHPLLKEELVNLPYLPALKVSAGKTCLDMELPAISGYRRYLDMRDGVLYREFDWKTDTGVLHCRFRRYLPRHLKRVLIQEMEFSAVSGECGLAIRNLIDMQVKTNGYNHFLRQQYEEKGGSCLAGITTDNGDEVRMASMLFAGDCMAPCGEVSCYVAKGETLRLTKLSAVSTSRDLDGFLSFSELEQLLMQCREKEQTLYERHEQQWAQLWDKSAVLIEGDDEAQKAVNFSVYHLLRCVNPDDSRIAICAKGFAGEAYFGHFFWDTEVYLLPFYLYTNPELASKLMEFRINTLPGACQNAREYGYPGARYPWESSVSGREQCPNWQYCDHEIHVTADVVHGLWHYYQATGDRAFWKKALPVLKETSQYWMARVEYREGKVSLNGVMGPDEYTCFCNNNAYTNFMAAHSLRITADAMEEAGEAVDASWIQKIRETADGLMASVNWDGIIPQCDSFEKYEEPDFSVLWPDKSQPFGKMISQERNYRTKALKQADVMMLPYLFPARFSKEQTEENFDYYFPYTTHDSSLSVIVHSILCSRMGRTQQAQELFQKALGIDLDETVQGAAEGIHIANCGGIWQGVVMGFAGMEWGYDTKQPVFHPRLPEKWKSLSFSVCMNGKRWHVVIRDGKAELTEIAVR